MARIDIKSSNTGGGGGSGTVTSVGISSSTLTVTNTPVTTSGTIVANIPDGYLKVGTGITGTLQNVVDTNGTATTLFLSSTAAQFTSPLRITTSDASGFYLDAEDSSTNNRFSIKRDPSSQEVTLDFASNPVGSTTLVGAIRTYIDGVNLSNAMSFIEDGSVGVGTNSPSQKVHIVGSLRIQSGGIYDGTNSIGTSGQVLSSTGTATAWITPSGGSPAGTTGAIQFNNAGAFGADSTQLFWDDANNRLGVGTATPTAKLQLIGNGATSATTTLLLQNSISTQLLNITDDGRATMGTNTANNAALLFQFPAVDVNGVLWGDDYSTIYGSVTLSRSTGEMKFFTKNGGYFPTFYSNGAERMRIDTAGRVGIGTAAPNASAQVQIDSTTRGFLPPRMTDAERAAISSPAEGLLVYNTDNHAVAYRDGTNWGYLCGALQTVAGSGGTVNIPYGSGNIADITLTASTTFTFGGHVVGTYILKLTQGGSGSYTVTWPASVLWSGGTAPTLTTTVGKTDIVTLFHDGTNFYGTYSLNY